MSFMETIDRANGDTLPLIPMMDYRRDFVGPIVRMIGLAAITILLMLSWLSIRVNQREFRAEQDAAAAAIKSHIVGMKQYLADCAAWDDALEHLVIALDRNWAAVKIGPYLFKSQGYENSFVIDRINRTTYVPRETEKLRWTVFAISVSLLRWLFRRSGP